LEGAPRASRRRVGGEVSCLLNVTASGAISWLNPSALKGNVESIDLRRHLGDESGAVRRWRRCAPLAAAWAASGAGAPRPDPSPKIFGLPPAVRTSHWAQQGG
jgi:hypothetical protein